MKQKKAIIKRNLNDLYSKHEIDRLKSMSFKNYILDRLHLFTELFLCCLPMEKKNSETYCVISLFSDRIIDTLKSSSFEQKVISTYHTSVIYEQSISLPIINENSINILRENCLPK